ncbi:hypothetical protein PAXRUDRAFT_827559 [Paxillus rubicundulus Ve08.2h10]|uniref:Uncharacterized protein n=1 Tax=Paxillus rubicundulus Ve08.2h10 TaxID=930991 RepID=A0A0D0DCD8_9AGAM|nr:hypothetical protein PAXRUDRAFT_827559 [Paxillus rubicundulus Ve08.2h10]
MFRRARQGPRSGGTAPGGLTRDSTAGTASGIVIANTASMSQQRQAGQTQPQPSTTRTNDLEMREYAITIPWLCAYSIRMRRRRNPVPASAPSRQGTAPPRQGTIIQL